MKYRDYIWIMLLGAACMTTSCAEDPDTEFEVTKPESLAQYEYLKEYAPLKDYATEGLKVGAAVDAAEYNEKGALFTLANSNFNEVVATYHMKNDQVVKNDGSMDFSTVNAFVDNATNAGLDVFGHVLCWHSGQNVNYLNSLIEDKLVADDPDATPALLESRSYVMPTYLTRTSETDVWTTIVSDDFSIDQQYVTYEISNSSADDGDSYSVADGVLTVTSGTAGAVESWGTANHTPQLIVKLPSGTSLQAGEEWQLSFDVKSLNSSNIAGICIQADGQYSALGNKYYDGISTSTTSETKTMSINVDGDGVATGAKIVFGLGESVDTFTIDNLLLQKKGSPESSTDQWERINFEGDFDPSNSWQTFAIHGYATPDNAEVISDGDNKILKITNGDGGDWGPQYVAMLGNGNTFAEGEEWMVTMKIKGDADYADAISGICIQMPDPSNPYATIALPNGNPKYYSNIAVASSWESVEMPINVDSDGVAGGDRVVFMFNTVNGVFEIDEVEILRKKPSDDPDDPDVPETNYYWGEELIDGGSFEGVTIDAGTTEYRPDSGNLLLQAAGGAVETAIGYNPESESEEGTAIKIAIPQKLANKWDAQVLVMPNLGAFAADDIFKVEFDVKSDNGVSISSAFVQTADYQEPFQYGVVATTAGEWTHYEIIFTNAANGDKFAMQFGDAVDNFYFDNISLKKGRIQPPGFHYETKTEEEKTEAITNALKAWVDAMIGETKGKVKVWDVVNETIMDQSPYNLRSTDNGDAIDGAFYYADYMGDDYVCEVINMARAAAGDEELTLFINDYGLEWYGNEKLSALLAQIEKWEAEGVTIEGIGSQMHINLSLDETTQTNQETGVTKMFEMLAETGKLIRISEIDMGIALGDNLFQTTSNTSEEQHKLMSDFYEFIVSEYFRIVPKAQQFGIAHWSLLDASDIEGVWKRNEPTGLWSADYNRKHTYAGFAEGLKSNN